MNSAEINVIKLCSQDYAGVDLGILEWWGHMTNVCENFYATPTLLRPHPFLLSSRAAT